VRQHAEIGRAHGADPRHDRVHAGREQREERVGELRPRARAAAREPVRADDERAADDVGRERRPDGVRTAEHRQAREAGSRLGLERLDHAAAEPGRQPVGRATLGKVALHHRARRRHPLAGLRRQLDRRAAAGRANDVLGGQSVSVEAHRVWSTPPVQARELTFLGAADVERLALTDDEILDAVDGGLRAQGLGETRVEPRVHLEPDPALRGHFNVLRGYVAPLGLAGVKVVGDYVDNHERGLASELGLLNLFDAATGAPVAIVDATALTAMRTGALTAIGARHLARRGARVLGHVGARGSAYWNVRLLDRLFDFEEIRVHSRRAESREAFARRLEEELGKPVRAVASWEACLRGADLMVEASRLERPEPLLRTAWVEPGCLVVPYGTMSAVELSLTDVMDKVVVDDWGQARAGTLGALRAHVDSGRLSEETLYAELCQIVVGDRPGRESDDERILFWHRGLSLSDIALGHALLVKARSLGVGRRL
jgi:ornithine cyclodeaminase